MKDRIRKDKEFVLVDDTTNRERLVAEKIIEKLKQEEQYLQAIRERCDKFNKPSKSDNNPNVAFQRAKMMGLMDACDIMGIDRSAFNWIHNI